MHLHTTATASPNAELEADYVIVGAGAMGMAFADTMLEESDASMLIVDRHAKPGGHWNDAYPFVTLHQPSSFYGVASQELSHGRKDQVGLNRGLGELASGAAVEAYFDEVMRHRLLPSGRVQYLPLSEYRGAGNDRRGCARSVLTGREFKLRHRRKLVDTTYLKTTVPSTHTPGYSVAPEVRCIPLNDLPRIEEPPEGFVVVGGGKTGMDACLWLLEHGVASENITWIMPRDGWLIDRATTQTTMDFFSTSVGAQLAQTKAIAEAADLADLFVRLEKDGVLVRLDPEVEPQMFHAATVSMAELEALRTIRNVVRMGRVEQITAERIELERGVHPTTPGHLYVDCSATAVGNLEISPVFAGDRITPQTVRPFQPVFSASMIAYVEAHYGDDEATKNRLCNVIPLPNLDTDWLRLTAAFLWNRGTWSQDKTLSKWLAENRLNGFASLLTAVSRDDPADAPKRELLEQLRAEAPSAMANLPKLIGEIDQFQERRRMLG